MEVLKHQTNFHMGSRDRPPTPPIVIIMGEGWACCVVQQRGARRPRRLKQDAIEYQAKRLYVDDNKATTMAGL